MLDKLQKTITSHPDDPSLYAATGYYAKNILGLVLASKLIWDTCSPFSVGMAIPTAGVMRSIMIDNASQFQSPEKKALIRGTLLPLFQGAYIAGAFMGFATTVKVAANAPSIFRSFSQSISHLFLIPLPFFCNVFLFYIDLGLPSSEVLTPAAFQRTYRRT